MRITNDIIMKLGGLAITGVTRQWMRTLDYRVSYYDPRVDPAAPDFQGPAIFLFWHEYIPFLFYLRGHCHVAMLLSRHQDAEWLSQAARHMGFAVVRGSTSRGGVSALRELMRTGETMNLTITPDGPRGPRRRLASGCIYASSRLGIPLVPGRPGLRPALAHSACLGSVRGAPALLAGAGHCRTACPDSHRPEAGRCGTVSGTRGTDAQHLHHAG